MVRTTILALDGALASSVTITIDVLAMANRISVSMGRKMPFEVQLVGSGAHLFRPFLAFAETTHAACDLFIVPAQGLSKAPCYRERLAQTDAIDARRMIDEAVVAGAHVASSCTGTLLLASGSQLNGLMATTAWWLAPVFHQMYPKVQLDTSELILTDGQFTTAGAAMAQMDLMMRLVARYAGAGVAESCARRMVLDERRSQLPYMAVGLLAASNEAIARAAAWARTRLQEGVTVNELASAAGLAPRTFARRLNAATNLSPVQFLQQLRVEHAVELIETTALSLDEIAYRVGYSDASTLRSLIRRRAGVGPREIRARARAASASSPYPALAFSSDKAAA